MASSEIESANSPNRESVQVPVCGRVFSSEEDLRTFYRTYAYHMGFGVCKISSRKKGDIHYYTLACTRHGHYVSSSAHPRPTTACDCPSRVNVRVSNGQYEITKVDLNHNHDLSPNKSHRFRSHKNLDMHSRKTLEINDAAGLRVNKSFSTLVHEVGDHDNMTFNQSEVRTCIRKTHLELGLEDAEALQQYFSRMTLKNGDFYYSIDLDEDGRLSNVFWADARCRAAYESFCDVITFDSTYLTNKYDVPFVSFVGVNHHGQSILLGCALLSSETTTTYTWLFRTWLECMSGCAPEEIFTDQCDSMREAIATVFPHTRHKLCIWHIMRKIPTKLGAHSEYKAIKKTLKTIVHESVREVEFELGWQEMVLNFGLERNDWLRSLYDIRKSWVPVYLKKHFLAGMSTTQRSENMNVFFDGCVNSKTSLKQFVTAYDNVLRDKAEKENQADLMNFQKNLPLVTRFVVEKQFWDAYTHDIIRKFQIELKALIYCNVREVHSGTYEVTDTSPRKDGQRTRRMILVKFTDRIMECECNLFSFTGIICRHIVATMEYSGVEKIYDHYILPRWRKDIRRRHTLIASSYDDDCRTPQMREYDDLVRLVRPGHEEAVTNLDSKALEWWKEYITIGVKKILSWTSEVKCNATCDVRIFDPLTHQRIGRPPTQCLKLMTTRPQKKKGKITVGESSNMAGETFASFLPTHTSLPTYLSQTFKVESNNNSPQSSSLPTYTDVTPERRSYSDVFCQSEDQSV